MAATQPQAGLVIGITGLMGSGKTAAAEYLAAEHGFGHIRYSHVLADWYKEDPDRKSGLQVVGWEVMSGGLQAELNNRLISKMTPERDWVVEGLRHRLDYEALKNTFASSFHLVYIDSPQQSRWSRLQKISRFRTFEEFIAADSHPVEQQIPALNEFAELCIASGHPLQQLYGPLYQLVASLRRGNQ
jgi:dephospho-CoA kinase